VLDPLVGDGTGEDDWAAHRTILGRPNLLEVVQSQLGYAAYASGAHRTRQAVQIARLVRALPRKLILVGRAGTITAEPAGGKAAGVRQSGKFPNGFNAAFSAG
jgi:hypothetical protein